MSGNRCMIPVVKSPQDYQAYRISPEDKNYLAIVFDPDSTDSSFTFCVEIFDVGGKTPSHCHNIGVEMFYVLKGEGEAVCDGKTVSMRTGDTLLVPPTGLHEVRNVGTQRLYVLCFMVPNEDFAELIRDGIPAKLDEEDLQVLGRKDVRSLERVKVGVG